MFPRAAEPPAPSAQPRAGPASLPVAGTSGRRFPAGEKISVFVNQSSASSQTAVLGGALLRVAFVLEVRGGERSVGDSEDELSSVMARQTWGRRLGPSCAIILNEAEHQL